MAGVFFFFIQLGNCVSRQKSEKTFTHPTKYSVQSIFGIHSGTVTHHTRANNLTYCRSWTDA